MSKSKKELNELLKRIAEDQNNRLNSDESYDKEVFVWIHAGVVRMDGVTPCRGG